MFYIALVAISLTKSLKSQSYCKVQKYIYMTLTVWQWVLKDRQCASYVCPASCILFQWEINTLKNYMRVLLTMILFIFLPMEFLFEQMGLLKMGSHSKCFRLIQSYDSEFEQQSQIYFSIGIDIPALLICSQYLNLSINFCDGNFINFWGQRNILGGSELARNSQGKSWLKERLLAPD